MKHNDIDIETNDNRFFLKNECFQCLYENRFLLCCLSIDPSTNYYSFFLSVILIGNHKIIDSLMNLT